MQFVVEFFYYAHRNLAENWFWLPDLSALRVIKRKFITAYLDAALTRFGVSEDAWGTSRPSVYAKLSPDLIETFSAVYDRLGASRDDDLS